MDRTYGPGLSIMAAAVLLIAAQGLLAQEFVYVDNDIPGANSVSAFLIGPDGALQEIPGSPFPTGGSANAFLAANKIAVTTNYDFLYVVNDDDLTVSGFFIDDDSGLLIPLQGFPLPTYDRPLNAMSLAITPNDEFLMVGHLGSPNIIAVFRIDPFNGKLTHVGSFHAFPDPMAYMRVSPDGKYLAVSMPGSINDPGLVGMYNIRGDGVLTPVPGSPFPDGGPGKAAGVDIDCASSFLVAGESIIGHTIVDVFFIGSNGALAPIAGSPFMPGVGSGSSTPWLSPNDQFLFVSNNFSESVTVFNVAPNGSLSLVPGSPFSTGPENTTVYQLATNAAGTFLYLVGQPNLVFGFSVATDGTLVLVPGSPFAAGPTNKARSLALFPAKSCGLQASMSMSTPARETDPSRQELISVVVRTTSRFDATLVDPSGVRFGATGTEAAPLRSFLKDADRDGDIDLILSFRANQTRLDCNSAIAYLTGKTFASLSFEALDYISLPCRD